MKNLNETRGCTAEESTKIKESFAMQGLQIDGEGLWLLANNRVHCQILYENSFGLTAIRELIVNCVDLIDYKIINLDVRFESPKEFYKALISF